MKKLVALAAVLLMATACQDAPKEQQFPPYRFTSQPPLRLNVAQITVDDNTQNVTGNVASQFPIAPAAAVNQWAQDRLQAVGATGQVRITLDEASVKEVALPKTDGIKGYFTDDQDARYEVRINASISLYDGASTASAANTTVNVFRARSINEDATVAQREQFYYDLLRDAMLQFDQQADPRVRQYFAPYTR